MILPSGTTAGLEAGIPDSSDNVHLCQAALATS